MLYTWNFYHIVNKLFSVKRSTLKNEAQKRELLQISVPEKGEKEGARSPSATTWRGKDSEVSTDLHGGRSEQQKVGCHGPSGNGSGYRKGGALREAVDCASQDRWGGQERLAEESDQSQTFARYPDSRKDNPMQRNPCNCHKVGPIFPRCSEQEAAGKIPGMGVPYPNTPGKPEGSCLKWKRPYWQRSRL